MDIVLIVAFVLPWVLVAVLIFILVRLIEQHGRVLHHQQDLATRLEAIEQRATEDEPEPFEPPMLPIGSEAPDVVLTDLEGGERRLSDYRGEDVALVFFSPDCGYCQELAPRLGQLPDDTRRVVLVSTGESEQVRSVADAERWQFDVLLERDWAAFKAFDPAGTPTGYLIDAQGRIASEHAMGVDGVLAMIGDPLVEADTNGRGGAGARVRDASESRLVRDGLESGTLAPTFVLSDIDGEMRSLLDFRGRKVLLVFSDTDCGPCDELAPDLVRLAEGGSRDGLEVVMISRGDLERNREKAREHGYTFPVLLQRRWEISKQYGMFATPIAFLIDEDGVIAEDVAAGADAIRTLAGAAKR
jgi:peroxiredoxin